MAVVVLNVLIAEIAKSLCEYSSAAKDAKGGICKLTRELFALKCTLEHFGLHARAT